MNIILRGSQHSDIPFLRKMLYEAVFWRAGERLDTDFSRGDSVDIVFRLGRNYFRNTETLQLTVLDLARAGLYSVDK